MANGSRVPGQARRRILITVLILRSGERELKNHRATTYDLDRRHPYLRNSKAGLRLCEDEPRLIFSRISFINDNETQCMACSIELFSVYRFLHKKKELFISLKSQSFSEHTFLTEGKSI